MTLSEIQKQIFILQGRYDAAKHEYFNSIVKKQIAEQNAKVATRTTEVCVALALQIQNKVIGYLQSVVQSALNCTMGKAYKFEAHYDKVHDRAELILTLYKNGNEIDLDTVGGLGDVISFAAQIAVLMMSSFQLVLIQDEPFPCARKNIRERLNELIQSSKTLGGIQMLMIQDVAQTNLIPDKLFTVYQDEKQRSKFI